jgi:DNA-cytosine methyltransferase
MVLLDLFSGTGGFAQGLIQAGVHFKEHYFSEIDPYAIANYTYHFNHAKNIGDITQAKSKNFKRPNLICFGSPCQDISIAGKRTGLKGKRSRLFFEAVRLINECRPDVFIFENVKGLFSSNQGKDFEVVLRTFADLGLYELQWQLLNTKWFLPQNRERIYFVGYLRGQSGPQVFPIGESLKRDSSLHQKKSSSKMISPTIDTGVENGSYRAPYVLHWRGSNKKWQAGKMNTSPALNTQQDLVRNPLIAQQSKLLKRGKGVFIVPEDTHKGYAAAQEGDSINLSYLDSNKRRGRIGKGIANTLDTSVNQYTLFKSRLRRFTPLECERLQGFDDNWTQYGLFDGIKKEISDTQRYKLMGNAVSVPVVKAIAEFLFMKQLNKQNSSAGKEHDLDLLTLELELELLHFKPAA